MLYLKSVAVGLLMAVGAVLVLVAALVRFDWGDGIRGAYLTLSSWQAFGAALIGFALGFWWMFRGVQATMKHAVSTPEGWAADEFTRFLDLTRRQHFATFVNFRPHYDKILDVDAVFVRFFDKLVDPEAPSAVFFLLLAHAAYRAAAGLAMSTQSAPAFSVMRQCLENSLYGLYIDQHPDALETWMKREVDQAAKQKMKSEFTIGNLKKALAAVDTQTHTIWSQLYEKTIDFGAHPNPAALAAGFRMQKGEKGIRFQVAYLTAEPEIIGGTMKSVSQTGVCSLLVFRNAFPKRFDQLGLTASLEQLRQGL